MTLSQTETRWAEIIGRTLVPKGVCGGAVDEISAGERMAVETRTTHSAPVALLYRVGLFMIWFSPPFISGRACTFGSLEEADRVKVLEALLAHRIYEVRMIAMVIKITICGTLLSDRALLVHLNAYRLAEAKPAPAIPDVVPQAAREAVKVSP